MSTAPASDPQDAHHTPASAPDPAASATPAAKPKPKARLDFDDPLDRQSSDDTDRGWGERTPAGGSAADLARFLDEKPPHHV
ncbi:hypothetical protein ABT144_03300 [Streptomyces sp. NPDC002039]|uniref:hypothetical protein n=1 Tax=unclassified Streptomyces TaxID=2593676 RepID=UPI003322B0DF